MPDFKHPKIRFQKIQFDKLEESAAFLKADHVFSCLGTTIKKAGSEEEFRKVDYDYVVNSAKISLQNGAKKIFIVSALGADKNSLIFYSRVKGEMEEAVTALSYQSIFFFRPSLLLGERAEVRNGEKMGEFFGNLISFALIGPFKKYKPIKAISVAKAMFISAKGDVKGVKIMDSDEIEEIACLV